MMASALQTVCRVMRSRGGFQVPLTTPINIGMGATKAVRAPITRSPAGGYCPWLSWGTYQQVLVSSFKNLSRLS